MAATRSTAQAMMVLGGVEEAMAKVMEAMEEV